jgi:hypothetical protein
MDPSVDALLESQKPPFLDLASVLMEATLKMASIADLKIFVLIQTSQKGHRRFAGEFEKTICLFFLFIFHYSFLGES